MPIINDKLLSLIMGIESDILQNIDFNDKTEDFSQQKSRKKHYRNQNKKKTSFELYY